MRKRPAVGEFRIHEHWGGSDEPVAPADDELAVGRAVLATLRTVPAYARVDLIHDDQQRPRVVELELVEPYLWFENAPAAADRLASLLMARIARHGCDASGRPLVPCARCRTRPTRACACWWRCASRAWPGTTRSPR